MSKLNVLLFILLLSPLNALAQAKNELPLYGSAPKTPAEKAADEKFIKEATGAAGSKEKAADHMIMRGQEALQKNDPVTAIKRFNQAYLLDEKNYRAYWGLGAAMGQQRKFTEAISLIKRAEAINDKDARLVSDHGFALVSEVVSSKPDQALAMRNFPEAEKLYRRAVELAPNDSLSYSRLAVLMYYKGDIKESRELVAKSQALGAEGLDPNFVRDLAKVPAQ